MLYHGIEELVGHTPLLSLDRYGKGLGAALLAKLESFNPGGSAKDRVALAMILGAEQDGRLPRGGTIIEPTSGNTGVGLAAVGTARGYRVIITMPDSMSRERQLLMRAYGAEVVLTPGAEGMRGAIARAEELAKENDGSWIAGQFDNPENPRAHERTTGPEIWEDTEGRVDILVAGVGTGGTLSGAAAYLKGKNPALLAVAVEPTDSPLLSCGRAGAHGLQGIGANFVPDNLDRNVIDEIVTVSTEEAYAAARALARTEGIVCGISSGAALHAAATLAAREENRGKRIVVVLPDTGERYLSTGLFE